MKSVSLVLVVLVFAAAKVSATAKPDNSGKSDAFEIAGERWQLCIVKAMSDLSKAEQTAEIIDRASEKLCEVEREQVKGAIANLILDTNTPVSRERIDAAWDYRRKELLVTIEESLSKNSAAQSLSPIPVMRGDVQKGLKAYNKGDYLTALARWLPKAREGDAAAQNNMGLLYEGGLTDHTPKSDDEAANWYSLAAAQNLIVAMQNLARVYTRNGHADLAQGWTNRAAELQSQELAAKQEAMGALGYALGCAIGGGCGSGGSYPTQSGLGSTGLGSNYLKRQYYQNGRRMCVYANGTILNAGLEYCPQTFGNR